MGLAIETMNEQQIDTTIQEDFIKILGYIASFSFLMVVIFSVAYILFPTEISQFQGIEIDLPGMKAINTILTYTLNSISSIFTYIFLVVVGIISFVGAQYLEDQMHGRQLSLNPLDPVHNMEVLENETVEKRIQNISGPYHVESKEELLHKLVDARNKVMPEKYRSTPEIKERQPSPKKRQNTPVPEPEAKKSPTETGTTKPISFSREKKKAAQRINKDAFVADVLTTETSSPDKDKVQTPADKEAKKEVPLASQLESFD